MMFKQKIQLEPNVTMNINQTGTVFEGTILPFRIEIKLIVIEIKLNKIVAVFCVKTDQLRIKNTIIYVETSLPQILAPYLTNSEFHL